MKIVRFFSSCALPLALLAIPVAAGAQPTMSREGLTVGATAAIGSFGHSHSGGGIGPFVSAQVELPLVPSSRVRLAAGTRSWTPAVDGKTPREPAGRVRVIELAVTGIRRAFEPTHRHPIAMYGGLGAGVYRYRIARGPVSNSGTWGLHGVGGLEYVPFDRPYRAALEAQLHAFGGPGHAQVWAYSVHTVSLGVVISRRF